MDSPNGLRLTETRVPWAEVTGPRWVGLAGQPSRWASPLPSVLMSLPPWPTFCFQTRSPQGPPRVRRKIFQKDEVVGVCLGTASQPGFGERTPCPLLIQTKRTRCYGNPVLGTAGSKSTAKGALRVPWFGAPQLRSRIFKNEIYWVTSIDDVI